jgi:hypothetical protein
VVLGPPSGELVAVARAIDVDADRGHGEPVEDGRGQGRIAEVLAPLAELDIRRDRPRMMCLLWWGYLIVRDTTRAICSVIRHVFSSKLTKATEFGLVGDRDPLAVHAPRLDQVLGRTYSFSTART